MFARIAVASAVLALPAKSWAQSFDAVGSRAAGMGGAFVAVADDASAAYWNPAGFAAGSLFSLVLDRNATKTDPAGNLGPGSQSGLLIGLGVPALGLSYYRLRASTIEAAAGSKAGVPDGRNTTGPETRLNTLITHHTGVTLVQSVAPGLAVGATVKVVRGIASSKILPEGDREKQLDEGTDVSGQASTHLDADLGVMATAGRLRAGFTLRNLSEPAFRTAEDATVELQRQARAGIAVSPAAGWIVAADLDVLKTTGPLGAVKEFAAGTEARVLRRAWVRGGLNVNTVDNADGRGTALTGGASYAATASLLLDAQVTAGGERAAHGWGVSARFVY